AFALLLTASWAWAATYYGYGLVPAEVRKFVAGGASRLRPPFWRS
ncbi:MAG: hypothetical protein JO086_11710, partial [Acidimicrobiia bacterium]|nr:hypothetical protein [Acidimicrobiia bacterium]